MTLARTVFGFLSTIILASGGLAQSSSFPANSILDSLQSLTASTIPTTGPSAGDLNPYGVAFVPAGFPSGGTIAAGNLLVANFNNSMNVQGTGTTIVSITPTGQQSLFATTMAPGIGLDTALGVLSRGFVVVGNLPVNSGVVGTGSLQVFNRNGALVSTITDATLLDSPWDLTINDQGSQAQIFVSNVLSGTVTRLDVSVTSSGVAVNHKTRIASGYSTAPNMAAVVVGPTGLAYDPFRDILYVASTDDNAIFGVSQAGERGASNGEGFIVFNNQKVLHGPLGLTLSPNGNLITANGDAVFSGGTQNDLVEFTPQGILVATYQMDSGNPGSAFGVASASSGGAIRFAAVDDNLNTVTIWTVHSFI